MTYPKKNNSLIILAGSSPEQLLEKEMSTSQNTPGSPEMVEKSKMSVESCKIIENTQFQENDHSEVLDESPVLVEVEVENENEAANDAVVEMISDQNHVTDQEIQEVDNNNETITQDEISTHPKTPASIPSSTKTREIKEADNKQLPKIRTQGGEPNINVKTTTRKCLICCSVM